MGISVVELASSQPMKADKAVAVTMQTTWERFLSLFIYSNPLCASLMVTVKKRPGCTRLECNPGSTGNADIIYFLRGMVSMEKQD
jgi:hypothetical protein